MTRNACVSLCTEAGILGVCEQERITRVAAAGVNPAGLPDEALDELLRVVGRERKDLDGFAVAETFMAEGTKELAHLEHHFAHACASFLPSQFDSALVVVCDHEGPHLSVWEGHGTTVTRVQWPWEGPGFADLYSQCAALFGFATGGREQRMEALARLNPAHRDSRVERLFELKADRLELQNGWRARIEEWRGGSIDSHAAVAAALQSRIGDLLIELLRDVKRQHPAQSEICLGGSLFFNSYLNTRVKTSGLFGNVFIPINPGNAGLAIGAALGIRPKRVAVKAFLGPSYSPEEIKATLDNCKLKYEWASDDEVIEAGVEGLVSGRLVGWFEGGMEWGPRALGGRSILANPLARYVLDNLNLFLKQREPWRGYALSGLESSVRESFDGPQAACFMEYDYIPKNDSFRHVLPRPNAAVRVHTAGSEAPARFRRLLQAFGEATGVSVVANTSFNAFREPIVCSPRDAIRVFFGTGVDLLVLDRFIIRK